MGRRTFRARAAVWLAPFLIALPASADEAGVRRLLGQKLLAGVPLESVKKVPWANLYEVVVRSPDGPLLYYVDERAGIVIAGQALDARTGRNYSEERLRELSTVRWSSLPLQWSITSRRGDGRRKIAIFSDPNCPYCKRFEGDLAKLTDITVHILPYPVLGPKSVRQSKQAWCSHDRAAAWNDLVLRGIEPSASADCDTPVEQLTELGRKLGATGTPTWFVETGERYVGALPIDEVTRILDAASPARRR